MKIRILGIAGLDAGLAACAAVASFYLYRPIHQTAFWPIAILSLCMALCTSLCFIGRGLYSVAEITGQSINWKALLLAWLQSVAAGSVMVVLLASFGIHSNVVSMAATLSLPILLVAGAIAISIGRLLIAWMYQRPAPSSRTIVVGEHESIKNLLPRIHTTSRSIFDLVGVVEPPADVEPRDIFPYRIICGLPLLGRVDTLERLLRQESIETVLIALPYSATGREHDIIQRVCQTGINVYFCFAPSPCSGRTFRAAKGRKLALLKICAQSIDNRGAPNMHTETTASSADIEATGLDGCSSRDEEGENASWLEVLSSTRSI